MLVTDRRTALVPGMGRPWTGCVTNTMGHLGEVLWCLKSTNWWRLVAIHSIALDSLFVEIDTLVKDLYFRGSSITFEHELPRGLHRFQAS